MWQFNTDKVGYKPWENFFIDRTLWKPKINRVWEKFKEENGGFLSERWYHLSPIENTVKVFYWRYQLDKCGLPIGRTWETVVLNLEE